MKKAHSINEKYQGSDTAWTRLDKAVTHAITRNPRFALEYNQSSFQLQFARQLRAVRLERKMSQAQFAKKAGLSQPFVARLENPKSSKRVSLETLGKVAYVMEKRLTISFED